MAARNLWDYVSEWTRYGGKIIYSKGAIVVVERDKEYLIKYNEIIIHIMRDMIGVRIRGRWHVSTAPHYRGVANRVAKLVIKRLPKNIAMRIASQLPSSPLVA